MYPTDGTTLINVASTGVEVTNVTLAVDTEGHRNVWKPVASTLSTSSIGIGQGQGHFT